MKGTVTAVVVDAQDRTADLTITVVTDSNVPVSTQTVLIRLDGFTEGKAINRIKDLLAQEIINASPLPYTKAQIEQMVLGMQVIVPG